ncbi:MAG TPA: aminotransferase class I/II-fold pyridoxal phosphate-dependent enzyme [Planctomycetota bacterium]
MSLIGELYALGKGPVRSLGRLVRGQPLRPTSFVAMTLDADDAALAERWLAEPARWEDDAPRREFEQAFARWSGVERAFAFAAGREAFSACLAAAGVGPGDEVVLPAYTCVVVRNAVQFRGATVVWADIELESFGPDVADVERRLTPRTRALVVQHTFGLVCRDYEALVELARRRGLVLIEDCAHATGAELHARKVGLRGDLAFYSSEHSKAFSTFQGGLALARDPRWSARLATEAEATPPTERERTAGLLRALVHDYQEHRDPARWWRGELARARGRAGPTALTPEEKQGARPAGYGRRLAAPLAAIGLHQLGKLDACNERRRRTALRWDEWCTRHGYARPLVLSGSTPIFLRYPVLVEPERKRDLSWGLAEFGIKPGVWFRSHVHPVREALAGYPRSAEAVARCINLPCLLPSD